MAGQASYQASVIKYESVFHPYEESSDDKHGFWEEKAFIEILIPGYSPLYLESDGTITELQAAAERIVNAIRKTDG